MQQNTYEHISDLAVYVEFKPAGTNFPANVTNVQQALAMTSPTQYATTTQAGVLTIATQAEVDAGVNTNKVVTPATLNQRLAYLQATTTNQGILALATNAEALAGTVNNKAVVPSSLKHVIDWSWSSRVATENLLGTIQIASTSAATAGVNDTLAMTPLKVKQAIAAATAQIPSYTTATESAPGLVQLATLGQLQQGTLRDGFAISPYTMIQLTGNNSRRGMVQAASQVDVNAGTNENLYVSAVGFKYYLANQTTVGTVKLTQSKTSNYANGLALSSNANVLATDNSGNQSVAGTVNFNNITRDSQPLATTKNVKDAIPIGSVQMWLSPAPPIGGTWEIANGQGYSKAAYPELFAVFGYNFGGSGDLFYGPDMRGLFVRGAGEGIAISQNQGFDAKGKPRLGVGCSGGAVGKIQKQQVRTHKHASGWGERYTGTESYYGNSARPDMVGSGGRLDWDNYMWFTNDGNEIESFQIRDTRSTLNSEELMGSENRPWNMSVNYIIKVK